MKVLTSKFLLMKNTIALLLLILGMTTAFSQAENRPENTGDDFSLEGALELFKNSNSLEDFEKGINDQNNNINNLDLNGDGEIDYINVEDIKQGDTHIIIMSTYLEETEKQDIAVITLEKTGDDKAVLQIEGDEDLFAKNTIVEPKAVEKGAVQNLKTESNVAVVENNPTVVNVWFWPSVRFLYGPRYAVWISPYGWRRYPGWWRPWRPVAYPVFYGYGVRYRPYYRPIAIRRVTVARGIYYPRRHTSTLVIRNRRGTTVIHEGRRGRVRGVRVRPGRVRGGRR